MRLHSLIFSLFFLCFVNVRFVEAEHVPNEIIVRYHDGTNQSEKNATAVKFKLNFKKAFKLTNAVLYNVDAKVSLNDLQVEIEKLKSVKYVSFNRVYRKQSVDPFFATQWYLDNTGQSIRWFSGTSGIDIGWLDALDLYQKKETSFVAVFDSGFAKDHSELIGRNAYRNGESAGIAGFDDDNNGYIDDINGWDFIDNDNDPYDFKGHGTQVAGIIAAVKDGKGIQGITDDTFIYPLRVLDRDGRGNTADIVEALEYVYQNPGVRIINISLGGGSFDPLLAEQFKMFEKDDKVLIVAAAGNGGPDGKGDNNDWFPYYPSTYNSSSIISVASIDQKGNVSSFSNYGSSTVDIAAPGESIRVATVERELKFTQQADGNGWMEQFFWSQSSKSWKRTYYGITPWMESPRSYTNHSTVQPSFLDLSNMKDPRLKLSLDFSLLNGGKTYLSVTANLSDYKYLNTFSYSNTGGTGVFEYDISEYAGDDSVWIKFSFYPNSTSEHFDIGPIKVYDVDTNFWGSAYYTYNEGTSFSAPIVSGVAALIMSHRPDLLASDIKKILMDSVKPLTSLNGKVKSGGMVRADKALELANTYLTRSSMTFNAAPETEITDNGEVKQIDPAEWNTSGEKQVMGRITGAGHYFDGDRISIEAIPEQGFLFTGWTQPGTDWTSDSATYAFTSGAIDYTVTANFGPDHNDTDGDGLTHYWEAYFGTDPNNPHSDSDSLNDLEEWQVYWQAKQLEPTTDDSVRIAKLEEILGKNSHTLGLAEGKSLVTSNPSNYQLFTARDLNASIKLASDTVHAAALIEGKEIGINTVKAKPSEFDLFTSEDLNTSVESAVTVARGSALEEGKSLVTKNPSGFDLYTTSDLNASIKLASDTVHAAALIEGRNSGIETVMATPSDFDLFTSEDLNVTVESAVTEARSFALDEGKSLVKANPGNFGLYSASDLNASLHQASETAHASALILGKGIGIELVLSNPVSFGLKQVLGEVGATPHTLNWYYQPDWGWLWTNKQTFPYVYRTGSAGKTPGWLYFKEGSSDPIEYYEYGSEKWVTLE